jgi:hypothetical protein
MDRRCRGGVSMTLFEFLPSLRQAKPRIDRAMWPLSAHVDELGQLCVGEMPLTEVANQFGTPTYVIDEADGRSIRTSRQQVSRSTERSANRSGWSPASPTPKPLATGRSRVTPPSCLVGRPRPDGSPTELKGPDADGAGDAGTWTGRRQCRQRRRRDSHLCQRRRRRGRSAVVRRPRRNPLRPRVMAWELRKPVLVLSLRGRRW